MSSPTNRDQLHNVLNGRTADGHVTVLPKLSFPKNPTTRAAAERAYDLMLRVLITADAGPPDDAMRTAIAWKLAAFISKAGIEKHEPSIWIKVVYAANYLIENPRLIAAPTGLGQIIELSQQQWRQVEQQRTPAARSKQKKQPILDIESYRQAAEAPPRPVVWQTYDGKFQLEELIHPFHVWEEGVRMRNCLCRRIPRNFATLVTAQSPIEELYELEYWLDIAKGTRKIYSLRTETAHLATLTRLGMSLTELQVVQPGHPHVFVVLADVVEHLEHQFGRRLIPQYGGSPNGRHLLDVLGARRRMRMRSSAITAAAAGKIPKLH